MTSKRHQIKSFLVICKSVYRGDYENVICTGSLSTLKLGQQNYYSIFPLVGGPLKALPSVLVPARSKPWAVFLAEGFPVALPSVLHGFEGWAVWQNGCDRLLLNHNISRQTSGSVARTAFWSSEFKLFSWNLSKLPAPIIHPTLPVWLLPSSPNCWSIWTFLPWF